jgi:protein-S-isoprenylcysteine O-methyltransferase
MLIRLVASLLCACWWTAEFTRSSLRDKEPVSDSDKGTSRLWDASHLIALIGMAVGFTDTGHVRTGDLFIWFGGLVLMLAGIALRWRAITTLGRYLTGTVRILKEHRLIRCGLYRYVRHPAYTGALGSAGRVVRADNGLPCIRIGVVLQGEFRLPSKQPREFICVFST